MFHIPIYNKMNRNLDKLYLNENKTQKRTLYMLACYQTKIGGSLKLVVANFCGVRAVFFFTVSRGLYLIIVQH